MRSFGGSLMLQGKKKKNVSPWFDRKAFCDPVSFTVSAPVAYSQAFLKWSHAISRVLVNLRRLFPLTVTLSPSYHSYPFWPAYKKSFKSQLKEIL